MAVTANTGSNNWNTNGAWVGGVQPTAADDVILPASAVVTIPTATTVQARSVTVQASATWAFASTTAVINIGDATAGAGNVALSISATATITLTGVGTINFISTSATQQTITTGGKTLPNYTINGAGSSYLLSDANTASLMTFSNGTFNTNNQTFSWTSLSSTAGTRSLTLGTSSGTVTTGNWNYSGTGSTLSAASSTLTLSGASQILVGDAGDTYGTINVSGSGTFSTSLSINCTTFTRSGTAAKTDAMSLGGNLTISGTCTLNANSDTNALLVRGATLGTPVTISAATLVCTNRINFRDITGAGAATWTTAASGAALFGNCLGNSGITFTPAADQTSTGTASFTWSTHGWTSRVPLPQDNVIINNAFIAGRTITVDMPQLGANIDCSGATGAPNFQWTVTTESYGNLTWAANVVPFGGTNFWSLLGRGAQTITSNGMIWGSAAGSSTRITINPVTGSYSQLDNMYMRPNASPSTLGISSGTYNTNNFNIDTGGLTVAAGCTFNPGTTVYTSNCTGGTNNVVNINSAATANCSSMTVSILSGTGIRQFSGGGKTYGTVSYIVSGSVAPLVVQSSNNTINTFRFYDGSNARTLTLPNGATTNFGTFDVRGGPSRLVTINSAVGGSAATISKTSGRVVCDYVSIQDSTATGGAAWYAGSHSTSVSNNSGWIFKDERDITGTRTAAGTRTVAGTRTAASGRTIIRS